MLVRVLTYFTAYPVGTRQDFRLGDAVQVADDFGRLLVSKGLVERVKGKKSPVTQEPDAEPTLLNK